MAQVHFSAGLRDLTGGLAQVEVEATTVRRLVVALEEMFPGIGEHLNEASSVAIDGEILLMLIMRRCRTALKSTSLTFSKVGSKSESARGLT